MHQTSPHKSAQQGVVLIEAMIAILIFSMGVLAIVGLQATMLMWRAAGTPDNAAGAIYLLLPRAVQPAFQKRLSMFVMRAKAKLLDATGEEHHAVVVIIHSVGRDRLRRARVPVDSVVEHLIGRGQVVVGHGGIGRVVVVREDGEFVARVLVVRVELDELTKIEHGEVGLTVEQQLDERA